MSGAVKAPCGAIFRCDGGEGIGLGHVVRCLALAEALSERGWGIQFAVSEQTAHIALLTRSSFRIFKLTEPLRAAELAALMPADLVVVDHYGLDMTYETAVRSSGAKLLVLEDIPGRRHDADILLDATFGRRAGEYTSIVSPLCRLLLGSDYALLRRVFSRYRDAIKPSASERLHRVFIGYGGIDTAGLALVALRALNRTGLDLEIDLVTGAASPHVDALRLLAQSLDIKANLHVDSDDVAALLSRADLALGASGTSSFERCALGIPSIVTAVADNQRDLYRHLVESGAAIGVEGPLPGTEDALKNAVELLNTNTARRAALSRNAAALCDAQGAGRVANVIETLVREAH